MGYAFGDKIVIPHQWRRYKVFEKYFPEWGLNVIAASKPWSSECQGFDPEGLKFFFLNLIK
jgi:hypothetical protein